MCQSHFQNSSHPPSSLVWESVCMLHCFSHVWLFATLWIDCNPPGSSVHGDSPGKNTGVGCHSFLQGIFPTGGSNLCLLCLLHCHLGSPFLIGVYTSVLYICVSISALQIASSIPFFWISQILVNIWYLFFSFWLISLCITPSRSSHMSASDPISFVFYGWVIFLLICITYLLNHIFFIHLFVNGHSFFPVSDTANNGAMSMGIQICLQVYVHFLCIHTQK